MDRELPSPAARTDMLEAEEVEGVGLRPRPGCSGQGFPPKRHEPRLLRMEGQSIPCKPLGQYLQDLLGILTVLEAQHSIVGVADYKHLASEARLHVALDPFIEYKMKVYVGQERADDLPLSCPRLAHQQPSVVDDTRVDPLPYQSEDACIAMRLRSRTCRAASARLYHHVSRA